MNNRYSWLNDYTNYIKFEAAKSTNPQAALELVDYMSRWSEETFFAGWIMGLEYSLWDNLKKYTKIKQLHLACDSWWIWRQGEKFVTTEDWLIIKNLPV
jgi:hypothetical protein